MPNFNPKNLVIANPGGELEGRKPLEYKDSLFWAYARSGLAMTIDK